MNHDDTVIASLSKSLYTLDSFDPLIEAIGDAQVVLLGEATHGTHEFYQARAAISKRLIEEKQFGLIAIEGDWPDAYRVHRYCNGGDGSPYDALADFERFPSWMWRNTQMVKFISWLREYNTQIRDSVGFYGLDLYSLHRSMQAVIDYLDTVDQPAAQRARDRYGCLNAFSTSPQQYGYFAALNSAYACDKQVTEQLIELQQASFKRVRAEGFVGNEELFYAQQNALVVKNAEHYYRSLFGSNSAYSWNVRDRHMFESFQALAGYRKAQGLPYKAIIWAHNTHIGDARATQMAKAGELNIGQLMREQYGKQAFLVGFTTYKGTVSAASQWGSPVERKRVRRALKSSYEDLFHSVIAENFMLIIRDNPVVAQALHSQRLERAIGVIYQPHTERQSHYFHAGMAQQFDAVIHFDETRALEPLDRTTQWDEGEFPETFPTGT